MALRSVSHRHRRGRVYWAYSRHNASYDISALSRAARKIFVRMIGRARAIHAEDELPGDPDVRPIIECVTGRRGLVNRPSLQKLVQQSQRGDVVLMHSTSRHTREVNEVRQMLRESLIPRGIRLETIQSTAEDLVGGAVSS